MIKLSQIKSFYDKYYFTLTMPLQQSNMTILMKMKINYRVFKSTITN